MSERMTRKGEKFSALTVEVFRTRALMLQDIGFAYAAAFPRRAFEVLGMRDASTGGHELHLTRQDRLLGADGVATMLR